MSFSSNLITFLYQTNAFKVADSQNPFWYTSGNIGPYYINAHFLFDGEAEANNLLKLIDQHKDDHLNCPQIIEKRVLAVYANNGIFKKSIDIISELIKTFVSFDSFDCIAGGERRDWFFSLIIANHLQKPHLVIYKNLAVVEYFNGEAEEVCSLHGKSVLHIADLLNFASSYLRGWIPAIKKLGGELKYAFNVVDRNQGGAQEIKKEGIAVQAGVIFDNQFLKQSLAIGYLNQNQYEVLTEYIKNPDQTMKSFLENNPNFIEQALTSADSKIRERAQLCLNQNIYGLNK
jgi:orotate phosphoribosyltransferase